MRIIPAAVILSVSALFLASCLDSNDPGYIDYFEANVSGDVTLFFDGSAYFGNFADPRTNNPGFLIQMASYSLAPSRSITLVGHLAGLPAEREYPVLVITEEQANENPFSGLPEDHFIAVYTHRQIVPEPEFFFSTEGTIEFTEVTADFLEASFSFGAVGQTETVQLDTVNVVIDGVSFARRADITVE